MERSSTSAAAFLLVLLCSLLLQSPAALASGPGKPPLPSSSYVVYLGGHPPRDDGVSPEAASRMAEDSHYDLLGAVLGDREKARQAIFYSYTEHINGFAAHLEPAHAAEIARYPGVVSVFPNRARKLHTTRSWQFMGFEKGGDVPRWSVWEKARYGEDAIIGNLDSGVWPESKSFDDGEMRGPIPNSWKGICQNEYDPGFRCNAKLVGARYFNRGWAAGSGGVPLDDALRTPRDENGHGTHTLATAGGAAVRGASALGYGRGTARGGAPRARVAAYRVCFRPVNDSECFDADIMAAFVAAIADGVHVISASVGGDSVDFLEDAVAIGSLHAIKAGVTVVCSASNNGPDPGTVSNVAPWVLTVAASSVDRDFDAFAVFNHTRIQGKSLSERWLHGKAFYPIISSDEAVNPGRTQRDARLCLVGSLDPEKVQGKIVVCMRGDTMRVEKGEAVRHAGGKAMILVNDKASGDDIYPDPHVLPAVHITYADGLALSAYLKTTNDPTGFVIKGRTILGIRPSPVMADFSSQGPNPLNPEILKPDVTAPGVNVIAAWTGATGPVERSFDKRRVPFNMLSGTSMSCPHVSGIAGLLKTLHPYWSPAAIKSAIMTTATELDAERKPILNSSQAPATPFSYGAGHVFPARALDPGLVYDMTVVDYLDFLCALGYNRTAIETFNRGSFVCPTTNMSLHDLNYPSITAHGLRAGTTTMVRRRLKNVGLPGTYTAAVLKEPEGVHVSVTPAMLVFRELGEEKVFDVSFTVRDPVPVVGYVFGAIVWSDGNHQVRSPLVVKTMR